MDALTARLASLVRRAGARLAQHRQHGATTSEYVIIGALVAGAILLTVATFAGPALALLSGGSTAF